VATKEAARFLAYRNGYLIYSAGRRDSILTALSGLEDQEQLNADAVSAALRKKGFVFPKRLAAELAVALARSAKAQRSQRTLITSYKFYPKSSGLWLHPANYIFKLEALGLADADPPVPFDDEPPPKRVPRVSLGFSKRAPK
jgi:hypothetical protein